ncbi:MAG: LysM peptidoglycan-binding domain-containing protein, partial [Desulfatirhabdiaceae bacterium]
MEWTSGISISADYRKGLIGLWLSLFVWFTINAESMLLSKPYRIVRDKGQNVFCEIHIVENPIELPTLFRQKGELAIQDYYEFMKIFRRINPKIQNIGTIRPGQEILIPLRFVPSDAYPNQTDGIVTLPLVTISDPAPDSSAPVISSANKNEYVVQPGDSLSRILMQAYGKNRFQEAINRFRILNPLISDINRIYPGQRLRMFKDQPESPPNLQSETETPFQQAAKILHARLLQNGDFFFPQEGASDFQLDLRRFPIMDLQDGHRILFNLNGGLQPSELLTIKRCWPNFYPIVLSLPTNTHRILEAVQAGIRPTATEVYHERIPDPASTTKSDSSTGRIICIHAETQYSLVEQIISCLGLIWHRQVELSFPYADVQIRALSNLIDIPYGMPVLVDFGQFSGDAEAAL